MTPIFRALLLATTTAAVAGVGGAVGGGGVGAAPAGTSRAATANIEVISQSFAIDPDQDLTITFRPAEPLIEGDAVRVEAYPTLDDRRLFDEFVADYDNLGRASDSLSFELTAVTSNADGT